ncbi:MAG: hypothetical protein WKF84_09665 [Pyrinomonadaceae bacterium]
MTDFVAPDVSLDMRVFGYTLLLSIVTGVVFGLVPALQASKPDVVATLKDEAVMLAASRSKVTLRNLLVSHTDRRFASTACRRRTLHQKLA